MASLIACIIMPDSHSTRRCSGVARVCDGGMDWTLLKRIPVSFSREKLWSSERKVLHMKFRSERKEKMGNILLREIKTTWYSCEQCSRQRWWLRAATITVSMLAAAAAAAAAATVPFNVAPLTVRGTYRPRWLSDGRSGLYKRITTALQWQNTWLRIYDYCQHASPACSQRLPESWSGRAGLKSLCYRRVERRRPTPKMTANDTHQSTVLVSDADK